MNEYRFISPLKILQGSSDRYPGPGTTGVVLSRAGGGKTACLVHIAFDKLLKGEKVVHVSIDETPEKVMDYYTVRFNNVARALELPDDFDSQGLLTSNRMILAYMNDTFSVQRLRDNLENLYKNMAFKPDVIVIDGLSVNNAGRKLVEGIKSLGKDMDMEIWMSALYHRHIDKTNSRGIPYPLDEIDDLFDFILQLRPEGSLTYLYMLKNGDNESSSGNARLQLDPRTFLVL